MPETLLDRAVPLRAEDVAIAEKLIPYVRRQLNLIDPIDVRWFPGGRANLTYLVTDAAGREVVVRRPPLGFIPRGAHDMEREYRVLTELASKLPFLPTTYALCTDTSVMDVPFFVMERIHGFVLRDRWPGALADDAELRMRMAESFLSAIVDLHQLDPQETALGTLGRPDGFMQRQLEGWQRRWVSATGLHHDERVNRLFDWLRSQRVPPQSPAIIHNDLKLDNAMFSSEDPPALVAMLDWDMCTLGDPLADIGTLLVYWAEPADDLDRHGGHRLPTAHVGFPTRAEFVADYARRTGRDVSGIRFYEVFGLVKIAVIMEQLRRRYREGAAADDRLAVYETQTPALWRQAERLAGLDHGDH